MDCLRKKSELRQNRTYLNWFDLSNCFYGVVQLYNSHKSSQNRVSICSFHVCYLLRKCRQRGGKIGNPLFSVFVCIFARLTRLNPFPWSTVTSFVCRGCIMLRFAWSGLSWFLVPGTNDGSGTKLASLDAWVTVGAYSCFHRGRGQWLSKKVFWSKLFCSRRGQKQGGVSPNKSSHKNSFIYYNFLPTQLAPKEHFGVLFAKKWRKKFNNSFVH